jgi:hypothetical protein
MTDGRTPKMMLIAVAKVTGADDKYAQHTLVGIRNNDLASPDQLQEVSPIMIAVVVYSFEFPISTILS